MTVQIIARVAEIPAHQTPVTTNVEGAQNLNAATIRSRHLENVHLVRDVAHQADVLLHDLNLNAEMTSNLLTGKELPLRNRHLENVQLGRGEEHQADILLRDHNLNAEMISNLLTGKDLHQVSLHLENVRPEIPIGHHHLINGSVRREKTFQRNAVLLPHQERDAGARLIADNAGRSIVTRPARKDLGTHAAKNRAETIRDFSASKTVKKKITTDQVSQIKRRSKLKR